MQCGSSRSSRSGRTRGRSASTSSLLTLMKECRTRLRSMRTTLASSSMSGKNRRMVTWRTLLTPGR